MHTRNTKIKIVRRRKRRQKRKEKERKNNTIKYIITPIIEEMKRSLQNEEKIRHNQDGYSCRRFLRR
jgi:hypothetical protein